MTLLELAEQDERTAESLWTYARKYAVLHRDIADDFVRGADALNERAAALRTRSTQEGDTHDGTE